MSTIDEITSCIPPSPTTSPNLNIFTTRSNLYYTFLQIHDFKLNLEMELMRFHEISTVHEFQQFNCWFKRSLEKKLPLSAIALSKIHVTPKVAKHAK